MGKIDKKVVLSTLRKYLLLTIGCFVLAFGDAAFISPLGLVTGGVLSIGVIIQYFVGSSFYVVDIVTAGVQVLMLGVSFLFLGKRYTIRSLFSTLLYPALFSLLARLPVIDGYSLGNYVCRLFDATDYGQLTLAALAGGVLIGTGVAICYHAGGSTGGLDVISSIIAKHTPIKEAVSAFTLDASLVIVGLISLRDVRLALVGVLGAFACALAVQYIYVNFESFVIADIISEKYEEIQAYVHETMDRATTVIDVLGGYSGQEKKILRVAFSSRELPSFRAFIGATDPKAFVTFTKASMINGEGFDPLVHEYKKKNRNK